MTELIGNLPDGKQPITSSQGAGLINRLVSSRSFQRWAARFPLTRRIVRREGEEMFDLVAGFCHSQILSALVGLGILELLSGGPRDIGQISRSCEVPRDRLDVLLKAGEALGLIKSKRGQLRLTRRAAALAGVPGLPAMIRHHEVLYRDLSDPVAFFRGETEPELAAFWPYVFGAGAAKDPGTAERYSELMADSQTLVAEDTLASIDLSGVRHLMDVGGGTGAFLSAVSAHAPALDLTLFDLPAVVPAAHKRFDDLGMKVRIVPGSFRDDSLPEGADAISLVRVLYDHQDETVLNLLRSVHDALPIGGRLIVSEPMTGSRRPERAGDAYFALYCLAMQTGRARSAQEITELITRAGFGNVRIAASRRPFITSVVEAVRQT
jgi:demethylspheroidene O-methyltransferase